MQQSGQQNFVGLLAAPNKSYQRRHHAGFMADQTACEQAKAKGFHSSQKTACCSVGREFPEGTLAALLQCHTSGAEAHTEFLSSEPDVS
jgi:hypothetical protein